MSGLIVETCYHDAAPERRAGFATLEEATRHALRVANRIDDQQAGTPVPREVRVIDDDGLILAVSVIAGGLGSQASRR